MKKMLSLVILSIFVLAFTGCGGNEPPANKGGNGSASVAPKQNESTGELKTPKVGTSSAAAALPASYPKEVLPLAADAEIIDVRENPRNKGLEVAYVSDNNVDTLRDFYEGALKGAKDLSTDETEDGYWINAKMDGVDYTIALDKNAMNPNPKYAGKVSVYIVLIGLEGISSPGPQRPEGEGKPWPSADLPGVPEFKGHIEKILREDGNIYIDIALVNASVVKNYVGQLEKAGFTFDSEPDTKSDHVQFFAFKDNSVLNFAYDAEESSVSIEYQK